MHYEVLNDRSTAAIPTSLKVTSGANGFKVMDPFDWTKDKAIYQRCQLWSEKARLTLDAMEGDSERTKISYFHHWINGEGMGHIESWKNSKTLIHQSAYDELDEDEKEGKYSSESICRATTRPPRSSSTAECLRLIARLKRGTGIYGLLGTSATV